jgi:hypothetical protein
MSKRVKGPWFVAWLGANMAQVCGPDGDEVALVQRDIGRKKLTARERANANMIAAAPEMYDALIKIREWLLDDGPIDNDGFWNELFVDANNAAHAAIAKAEGA